MPILKCVGCKHIFGERRGYNRHTGTCKSKIEKEGKRLLAKRQINAVRAATAKGDEVEEYEVYTEMADKQEGTLEVISVICHNNLCKAHALCQGM